MSVVEGGREERVGKVAEAVEANREGSVVRGGVIDADITAVLAVVVDVLGPRSHHENPPISGRTMGFARRRRGSHSDLVTTENRVSEEI